MRTDTDNSCIGTDYTRSIINYGNQLPTTPNNSQRSPTASSSFGTLKDTSKHQEKSKLDHISDQPVSWLEILVLLVLKKADQSHVILSSKEIHTSNGATK
ncbi:hypothetical protein GQ457_15G015520 [Hibiscus cannabinus]